MEKSFVGDPIRSPGLVYAPLNTPGVLFVLGSLAAEIGLVFEEFHSSGKTAVCRRKTEHGWERIRVGLAVRSSQFREEAAGIDLLACWIDDSDNQTVPKIELSSRIREVPNVQSLSPEISPSESSAEVETDFPATDSARESFEETIRQLDDRIKKLKSI